MPIINLHCFEKRGTYFLVDKYSRRYGVITEAEYQRVLEFKRSKQTSAFEEIEVTEDELEAISSALHKLDSNGLTTEKFSLPDHLKSPPTIDALKERKSILYLHVTGACNLRCPWCYTGEKINSKLGIKNARHAIDTLAKTGKNGPYIVRFFGGEPLMNMDIIKQSVDYCNSRPEEFEYTITTNGLLLNESNSEFLTANDFLNSISIMGYEQVHNEARIFINGKGSYEKVITRARNFFKDYSDYKKVGANITVPT